jgi:hypothetical protein
MINVQEKKNKITSFLKESGPSLPVRIAKAIDMDPVFASAILSELLSTKTIKTSNMKIGASPLYLLPGQEQRLEEKTDNLKLIEKETQEKLKKEKIIFDEQEEPATRVALRNIKDFATPFKFKNKITWKYAFAPQEEIDKILFQEQKPEDNQQDNKTQKEEKEKSQKIIPYIVKEEDVPKAWEVKKEEIKQAKQRIAPTLRNSGYAERPKKIENIFKEEESKQKKTNTQKTFLEKIEQFLENQNTSILSLEEVDKKRVTATIESNSKPLMLFAFNKVRINESELLSCYKTANKKNLSYQIIINGNLTKKLTDTILAHQKLDKIHKLENLQP